MISRTPHFSWSLRMGTRQHARSTSLTHSRSRFILVLALAKKKYPEDRQATVNRPRCAHNNGLNHPPFHSTRSSDIQTSPYSTRRRATALRRKCSDSAFDIRCCGVAGAHDTRDPAAPASPARSGTVHIQRPGSTWTLESPRGSAGGVFCWRWAGCVETALVLACPTHGRIWGLVLHIKSWNTKARSCVLGRSLTSSRLKYSCLPKYVISPQF